MQPAGGASTAGASTSGGVSDAAYAEIKTRMIESGEYQRLLGVLKSRLDEAGWEDNLRGIAREKARQPEPPNLPTLVKELEAKALESVPPEVLREIHGMIAKSVGDNVER